MSSDVVADPASPTGAGTGPSVVVSDEQTEHPIDASRWADLARAVLLDHEVDGELTLSFVDRDEMTELNSTHMGVDAPTDVLAFPLDADGLGDPGTGIPVLVGDVVICPSVAVDAVDTHAGTFDDEIALLVVHGVLHVLGHDHADPDESAAMRAAERRELEAHHWRGAAPDGFSYDHVDDRLDLERDDAVGERVSPPAEVRS